MQHLGVALITFREDGTVQLMNTAARHLLHTGPIRQVEALKRVHPDLVAALRSLDSGEQTMVRVEEADRTLQLAVRVRRFQLQGEPHALASVQDLRNELEEKEMEAWQQLTSVLTHEIMNSVAPISSLASTAHRRLQVPSDDGAISAEEAADVQDKIFVPFFTTKEEGSGIGLSLARRIMRLHGGTISVRSTPGEGTVFALRF
ncbi:MAG: ATP-binding protein [Salinivenus sp.]